MTTQTQRTSFVPPPPRPPSDVVLYQPDLPSPQPTAKSDDTAVTITLGSLIYSGVYIVVFFVVVVAGAGLVLWYNNHVDPPIVGLVSLLVWGGASYAILSYNREQGLHHSPTGIAHHEIESRERIAEKAIDAHIYLLERRWEREDATRSVHQLPGI